MRVLVNLLLLAVVFALPARAEDMSEERTAHRSLFGAVVYPDWFLDKPEHYEFSAAVSNYDPLTQHPHAYDGADWDPSKWNKQWTPETTVGRFFKNGTFVKQYARGAAPALAVGPQFFRLSDLDQRRSLKLLADYSGVFKNGARFFYLVDDKTGRDVGTYSPRGMFLY